MKTSDELLGELKAARDHHRAEAKRLDAAIAALEGPAVTTAPPIVVQPAPAVLCNCATFKGLIPCPIHGAAVAVPWRGVEPSGPLFPWMVLASHGGNCACPTCVSTVYGGVYSVNIEAHGGIHDHFVEGLRQQLRYMTAGAAVAFC